MALAPYQDKQRPTEERVEDLIQRMTLEEKVGQMMQLAANIPGNTDKLEDWHIGSYLHCTRDLPNKLQKRAEKTRLGIPIIFGIDAIHGHCFENEGTVFPTQLSISCSWDKNLIREMGAITATEVRACGIHWTFSPVLCVGRDTRWGRINETFGEDPWLIGELAAEMIIGYQGGDTKGENLKNDNAILACAKHYAGYGEANGGRDAYEASITQREMLDLYLPPFEKAVKKAGVATLMAGYQAIDGVPCSADAWLMRELPKNTWGMDGFIVTDWNNIGSLHDKQNVAENYYEASFQGLVAGNDMIMSTPEFYENTISLINDGRVDIALLDDAVKRILRYKFKLGLFDEKRYTALEKKTEILGNNEHWQKALAASRASMTLLSNNGILPLDKNKLKKILLVGPNAQDLFAQLGDWSFGSHQASTTDDTFHKDDTITVLQALKQAGNTSGFIVDYVKGADTLDATFNEIPEAQNSAEDADIIIACIGDTNALCGEFHDRSQLELTGQQQALLEAMKATGKPLVTVFVASKPLAINWVKENSDALLCAFNPGAKGGQAIKETLFGELNPSGKLTISFPYSAGQLPVHYNKYKGWHASLSEQMDGGEHYIDAPEAPVFSFGQGISYTTFTYADLKVHTPVLQLDDALSVSVTLQNSGKREGVEIAQLYINDIYSSVTTPVKSLRGFERVVLKPGEAKTVTFTVPYEDLSIVNRQLKRLVEPGQFEVMIGASSRDEDLLKTTFTVAS